MSYSQPLHGVTSFSGHVVLLFLGLKLSDENRQEVVVLENTTETEEAL